MLLSHLTRWFARSAIHAACGEGPPVVAPALPAARTPRFLHPTSAVQVVAEQTSDGLVIRVKGNATVACAGALLDGLLTPSACRLAVVTLDLSELRSISTLAMGVLVGYHRGVVRRGGRVRLAGALQPEVSEALARAEVLDLFETTACAAPSPNRQAGSIRSGVTATL